MKQALYLAAFVLAAWTPAVRGQTGMSPMTKEQKIANAMKAAPGSIAANATVLDWPATEGGQPVVLRQGTNGWNCFPDFPASQGNDPMCVDATWLGFLTAMLGQKPPEVRQVGFAYMIAPGGGYGSNTDPFATKETADNQWGYDPPHLMIVFPSAEMLSGIPTDRNSGGAWVMWKGTAYAHVMIPIAPGKP